MCKQITHGDESRQAILRGINSLANAVNATLGPSGPECHSWNAARLPDDALENLGAQMVREWPNKTRRATNAA